MTRVSVRAWTHENVATGVIPFDIRDSDRELFEMIRDSIYNPNVIIMQRQTTRPISSINVSNISLEKDKIIVKAKARGGIPSTILMKFVIELAMCVKQILQSSHVYNKSITLFINDNIPFNLILSKC